MMPCRRRRRFAGLILVASVTGCGGDSGPRRVPDDGAPCSAVMPGAPEMGQVTYRLGSVNVTERAWGLQPAPRGEQAGPVTRYFVRRATLPVGSPVRDEALLQAAASRVGKGIALQDGTKPTVSTIQTASGPAIDLRWTAGTSRNATRMQLTPSGYCEATILTAASDAEIATYFGSVQVRPDGAR